MKPVPGWKDSAFRKELLALYAETDLLLSPYGCDASAECCDFANTGREPYPTPAELAEVDRAMRERGIDLGRTKPAASKRALPIAGRRRCPLLGDDLRCRIYASRPFGCRTYFCERMTGPNKLPRAELQRLSRAIADLSARFAPRDPRPRPLLNALRDG